MAGFNNQASYGSYTHSIPSEQMHYVGSSYINNSPNQTIIMDSGNVNMDSNTHCYQPPSRTSYEPPSQVFFSTNLNSLDCIHDGNEPVNTTPYEYVENNEERVDCPGFPANYGTNNYGEPSIRPPPTQTSSHTPSTPTFFDNANVMTSAIDFV